MSKRVAAVDLGKASAKFVRAVIQDSGKLQVEDTERVFHNGSPLSCFVHWYKRTSAFSSVALAATGLHSAELVAPVLSELPEEACLQAALSVKTDITGPVNLIRIGASGYSVLARDALGRIRSIENEKCSSGTGETMVKTAARFGLAIEEADAIAQEAAKSIPITARCSVFAKSEMTHFGNQGCPKDQLFLGYFDSIARYASALLSRIRVDGPIFLIGGGSTIKSLRTCLKTHLKSDVLVPEDALSLEVLGAAQIAAEHTASGPTAPLPRDPGELIQHRETVFEVLEPARKWAPQVKLTEPVKTAPNPEAGPVLLGLDLGSTGSKAALTSIENGEMVFDLYDRTRGNPVRAAQQLVRGMLERHQLDVRAIGVTGSGREAVATVLRAAYPEHAHRIVVLNEIVAHATAAIRCDDRAGESLTVVEIGGQDAKFIQIAGGQIVASDMNQACSAGTGSFFEEQGLFYGVEDITEFTHVAEQATRPPDLGQMCTVFVAEAAKEAETAGFELSDIFAGFQYAVIHNYLNRVMKQRTFGQRIFFQGKPASAPGLAWTLAAVTGREVVVPPNPGAMGAWGIGLCALQELDSVELKSATPLDLGVLLSARISERDAFRCKDPKCSILCNIDKTTVAIGEEKRQVFSGGACAKFEISTALTPKLDQDAPSAFDERETLLEQFMADKEGRPTVALPDVGAIVRFLPWASTFLGELGLSVRVLRSNSDSLQKGEALCYSYDSCAPVKVAHAVIDSEIETLFLPKVFDYRDSDGVKGVPCANQHGVGNVVEAALKAHGRNIKFVTPSLSFASGFDTSKNIQALSQAAGQLGVDPSLVPQALRKAAQAQERYERELAAIGERTLSYGRAQEVPVVVVCGSLHVILDRAVNADIPGILRQNGVLAMPMDCYPVRSHIERLEQVSWGDQIQALRAALSTRERGDVYPLLITSFACGPSSFVEHVFNAFMRGYPHTSLETDGHGGKAGYVTRIQSFLHGVRRYHGGPAPVPKERLELVRSLDKADPKSDKNHRLVIFPMGDRYGDFFAAAYRAMGFDAVCTGRQSATTLARGRRDCSGKECLPYQLMWGAYREYLNQSSPKDRLSLITISGEGSCRSCVYQMKDRISLEHLGLSDRVSMQHFGVKRPQEYAFLTHLWPGLVALDLLNQFLAWYRPQERDPGQAERIYTYYCDRLISLTEQPIGSFLFALFRSSSLVNKVIELVEEASREYASLDHTNGRPERLSTVFMTGSMYTRIDPFANQYLVRQFNQRGMRVLLDPLAPLIEYLLEENSAEALQLPTGAIDNGAAKLMVNRIRRKIYRCARVLHPWLPGFGISKVLSAGSDIVDRYPVSESPVTIGAVLYAWGKKAYDGAVIVSPWGCNHALISEALLRHQHHIPMLFLYTDGSPIDERRINDFIYKVQRSTSRRKPLASGKLSEGKVAQTGAAEIRA